MLDNLRPGMRIKAIGPVGLVPNAQSAIGKYLFISAGSGVIPMMWVTA